MKKILILSLILVSTFTGTLFAVGINGQYDGFDIVNVQYEGQDLKPDSVPAILYKGSTMVPLGILRRAGFDVDWSQDTLTANIKQKNPDKPVQTIKTIEQIHQLEDRITLIYGLDDNGVRQWQGSGFMLNSRGLLITAEHVLQDNKGNDLDLEIIVNGKTFRIPKGVVAFRDSDKDIAGLHLYDNEPFPYLIIGEPIKKGDKIYSVGYPNQLFKVYEGKVEYTMKIAGQSKSVDTTAPKGGTSGGAQLNQYGEVVGVILQGGSIHGVSSFIKEVEEIYFKSINQ